jgi:hypothetical protein
MTDRDELAALIAYTSVLSFAAAAVVADAVLARWRLTPVEESLLETRVSDIEPYDQWLLEGAWVDVVGVEIQHPDDRVTISYTHDGEEDTTRRGFEVAIVKRPPVPVDEQPAQLPPGIPGWFCTVCQDFIQIEHTHTPWEIGE